MSDPDEVKRGLNVATGFIAYRMRSGFEVRRRLKRADLNDDDIETVILRLQEMKLINDSAFAGAFSRDQMLGMKRGPIRVANGLLKLGVDKEIAGAAIEKVLSEYDSWGTAMALGEKRWGELQRLQDLNTRKKRVYEFLVRRGFPFDESRRVVDQLELTSDKS